MPRRRKHPSAVETIDEFTGSSSEKRRQGKADEDLLTRLLEDYAGDLSERELEAFSEMAMKLETYATLTDKQRKWVEQTAERLGLEVENPKPFSSLTPKEQAEHRKRAAKVQLPWEREGHVRPLRPPGK